MSDLAYGRTPLPKRRVSFVDHVSFLVMKSRGIEKALAFDPDSSAEGFSDFRLRRSLCDPAAERF